GLTQLSLTLLPIYCQWGDMGRWLAHRGPAHSKCHHRRQSVRNGPATLLPRLEDSKMIGVIDKDAPKKAKGQQSVEVRSAGVLTGAGEGDERDLGYFERTENHILGRQSCVGPMRAVGAASAQ